MREDLKLKVRKFFKLKDYIGCMSDLQYSILHLTEQHGFFSRLL